jgi:hypothetical protein
MLQHAGPSALFFSKSSSRYLVVAARLARSISTMSSAGLVERDPFTDMGGMGFESAMSAGLNLRRRSNDELFQDFGDGQLLQTLQQGAFRDGYDRNLT